MPVTDKAAASGNRRECQLPDDPSPVANDNAARISAGIHAVIAGMSGISELQRRNASPVHVCCASALKAKPEVEKAQSPKATAIINPAGEMSWSWRNPFC